MSNLTFDGGMFLVFIFFSLFFFFGGVGWVCIYNYKIANIHVTLSNTSRTAGVGHVPWLNMTMKIGPSGRTRRLVITYGGYSYSPSLSLSLSLSLILSLSHFFTRTCSVDLHPMQFTFFAKIHFSSLKYVTLARWFGGKLWRISTTPRPWTRCWFN